MHLHSIMSYLEKVIAKLLKHLTGHEQVACRKHAICHSVYFLYFDVFIAEQELYSTLLSLSLL